MSVLAESELYYGPMLPLQPGERLDQPTFHARYENSPEDLRAELIGGIVYIMSPVSDDHSTPHSSLTWWLVEYEMATPGTAARVDATIVLGPEDEVRPDACLRVLPSHGGRTRVVDRYIHGAPELVVEVAISSAPYDMNAKKEQYRRAGVDEYLAILPEVREVYWFQMQNGRYEALQPGADGILRSHTFPGLWLDKQALLADDKSSLRAALHRGLASEECREWVKSLTTGR